LIAAALAGLLATQLVVARRYPEILRHFSRSLRW
jgi:hypothetical protein